MFYKILKSDKEFLKTNFIYIAIILAIFSVIQILDSFSPLSFYGSVCAELSNGKNNSIALYEKAHKLKKSYLTWNLKRRIMGPVKSERFRKLTGTGLHDPNYTVTQDERYLLGAIS